MNMIDEVENLMNSTHYKTAHRFGKMLKDKFTKSPKTDTGSYIKFFKKLSSIILEI